MMTRADLWRTRVASPHLKCSASRQTERQASMYNAHSISPVYVSIYIYIFVSNRCNTFHLFFWLFHMESFVLVDIGAKAQVHVRFLLAFLVAWSFADLTRCCAIMCKVYRLGLRASVFRDKGAQTVKALFFCLSVALHMSCGSRRQGKPAQEGIDMCNTTHTCRSVT